MHQRTKRQRAGLILGRMVGTLVIFGVLGTLPGMLRAGAVAPVPELELVRFEQVASQPLFHSQSEAEMDLSLVLGPPQNDIGGQVQ